MHAGRAVQSQLIQCGTAVKGTQSAERFNAEMKCFIDFIAENHVGTTYVTVIFPLISLVINSCFNSSDTVLSFFHYHLLTLNPFYMNNRRKVFYFHAALINCNSAMLTVIEI